MIKLVVISAMALAQSFNPQCTCNQLLTKSDCNEMSSVCSWNLETISCEGKGAPKINKTSFVCDNLSQDICKGFEECAWVNGFCIIFPGCTPFTQQYDANCKNISKRCTSNGTHCVEIDDCIMHLTQKLCKVNKINKLCYWQESNSKCIELTDCDLLPKTLRTEDECRKLLTYCTIAGNGKGCALMAETCGQVYQLIQCTQNRDMTEQCYLNDNSCHDRTCINASSSIQTHEKCQEYSKKCTVAGIHNHNISMKIGGCQDLAACSSYIKEDQCHFDKIGNPCIWNGDICFSKTCATAQPSDFPTAELCRAYLPICTVADMRQDCKEQIITCDNAPMTIVTEQECANYLKECTTKNKGGCVTKSTCQAANVDAACTTDINGAICIWDNHYYRDATFEDYPSTSYEECQFISQKCVYGQKGFCQQLTLCSNINNSNSCKRGIDGYCIWITDYNNSDEQIGTCLLYSSCTSLPWNTHAKCNRFFDKCTTNGTTCIPITLCNETNTNGGCVIRNDGTCMQIIDQSGLKCVYNDLCQQIRANTHDECQSVNSMCTTNGTGCIDLANCPYQSQAGCYQNQIGVLTIDGNIQSTGKCVWDTEINNVETKLAKI